MDSLVASPARALPSWAVCAAAYQQVGTHQARAIMELARILSAGPPVLLLDDAPQRSLRLENVETATLWLALTDLAKAGRLDGAGAQLLKLLDDLASDPRGFQVGVELLTELADGVELRYSEETRQALTESMRQAYKQRPNAAFQSLLSKLSE